ncbi:nuclear transport factor 2 family protein [Halotia wernerae UHCC 0503]|nr:nuclear transport factor 2 family protein [Halotia wernerae UHCC 0503]
MTTKSTITSNEAQIRQLIADQQSATCAKDIDQIMSRYATGVIIFDVKPPFQIKGKDTFRRVWSECLPYFPDSFEIETRDLNITVSDDLAVAHWLSHFTGMEPDHPAMQTWMRITAVCQRHQGEWQILHEHISVPFNPETSQAVFTLDP